MNGPAISVNGEHRPLATGLSVGALVAELGLEPRGLAVAVNGEVVARRAWDELALTDGDKVEVLTVAQGG